MDCRDKAEGTVGFLVIVAHNRNALGETAVAWRRIQDDVPSRSEAIRRLIAVGLTGKK